MNETIDIWNKQMPEINISLKTYVPIKCCEITNLMISIYHIIQ